jgi:hypothetical protein
MRAVVSESMSEVRSDALRPRKRKSWWIWLIATIAILLVIAAILLARAWPFTQANVIRELELATSSHVRIGAFRRTYFPRPGCVAEQVTLERGTNPQDRAVMTMQRLSIEGNITRMLSRHVALIRAEGAHLQFPPIGAGQPWKPTESSVIVDELIADGALLEFARHDSRQPKVRFLIDKFAGHHLASHDAMRFEVEVQNPTPPGEISATGSFGPWGADQVSRTPVSGNYTFRNADLGAFGGILGTLSSDGTFRGTLESIAIDGKTATPNFAVKGTPHRLALSSEFHAEVDSTNGDVTLHQVQARLQRTLVSSRGTVAEHRNEDGKRATLDLAVQNGRIQDLLLLFVSDPQAPLNGQISIAAKTVIPQGKEPFLRRLQMTGDFGIADAFFTKLKTQEGIDKLSTQARGQADQVDDPERVVSNLQGHVEVRDGIATFSSLSFRVPGAKARLDGTFDLITQKVNFHGMLFMEAKLPQATSGIKSFLLKAIDPFLKKNRRGGAKFPVSITGTYQHPSYHADPV